MDDKRDFSSARGWAQWWAAIVHALGINSYQPTAVVRRLQAIFHQPPDL
jgi:hypothetical protein